MSVEVRPGESIQAVVDENPAGTLFVLKAGIHHGQSVVIPPKSDLTFQGEPGGTILQGDGKLFAFAGKSGQQTGDHIVLKWLEITGYAPARQQAVIQGGGEAFGWVLEDLIVHHNANVGIGSSQAWEIRRCYVHHQGTLGIAGQAALWEDCEIAWNNTEMVDPGWEGGGSKFVYADGVTVRRCKVHDNYGMGLWTDGNIRNIIFEDNEIRNNAGPGVDIEISHQAVICNNLVEGNGDLGTGIDGSGILIAASDEIEVYGNTVRGNNGGIGLKNTDRSSSVGGPYILKNVRVHDNHIVLDGQMGIVRYGNVVDPLLPEMGNVFYSNQYELDSLTAPRFRLNETPMAWPQWQGHWTGEVLYVPTPVVEKPGKVTNFIVTPEYALLAAWAAVEGATRYKVRYRPMPFSGQSWTVVSTKALSRRIVTNGSRYQVQVAAVNSAGQGPWSTIWEG